MNACGGGFAGGVKAGDGGASKQIGFSPPIMKCAAGLTGARSEREIEAVG